MNKTCQPAMDRPVRRLPHQHAWIGLAAALWIAAAFVVQCQPTPSASLPKDLTVSLNATAQFQVSASGTGPLTFQWWFKDAPVDPALNPKATTTLLVISNVNLTHAGTYWAVVSDATSSATSRVATLTVDATFTKITSGPIVEDREASAAGASWGDVDNDGLLDLFVPNNAWNSGGARDSLYRNLGGDEFVRMTNAVTARPFISWSGLWADYNNDGNLDLFVVHAGGGKNELFRNEGGGVFTPVTCAATAQPGTYADGAWVDLDRDGWLDLMVTTDNGEKDFLFRNRGDGTFTAWTSKEIGLMLTVEASTYAASFCDVDNDGDLDLYVANYKGANFLYRNDGTGRLVPVTAGSLPGNSATVCALWGDFNNDGLFDLFTTSGGGPQTLHLNRGNWKFEDVTVASGLALNGTCWSPTAGDYDNDGNLDLYVPVYYGKDVLYHNNGDGTFSRVDVGSPLTEGTSDEAVWVDYNNDGFLDLFKACGDLSLEVNLLYRNSLPAAGNTNHWLKIQLRGTVSNRSAIGARVGVRATIRGHETWQVRQIMSTGFGGGAMGGLIAHFGLGDATNVDLVRIEWPSGNVQELSDLSPDQVLKITEAVLITPAIPSSSLGGSVTLASAAGGAYQWQFNGVDLAGQTNRTLKLTNIQASQQGRYSVVVTSGDVTQTNYTYVHVDTQFTKITTGPLVTDLGSCFGAAWGDFDGDGYADVFAWRYRVGLSTFYHNNRDGTFSATAAVPSQQTPDVWYGGVSADFDNDGKLDLFVPREGKPGFFYFNSGDGTFTASQFQSVNPWSVSAVDYNRDGLLDLYISNAGLLFRNNGDRTFTRARSVGGGSAGAAWADYDDDGWLDVFCASGPSQMFHNDGTGGFVAVTNLATQTSAIVGAWGDYDNDGRVDLCAASFGGTTYVYRNLGNGHFERAQIGQTIQGYYNGAAWGDYDNDGFLDLFLTYYGSDHGNQLFHNNGDGTFTRITTGSIVKDLPIAGGLSYNGFWFDYDNDGFLDLFVPNGNDAGTAMTANFLYHNNGNKNAWLKVKLVGTTSNRFGVGAKVRVQAKYAGQVRWQRRDITAGDIYNGNNLDAHFGLANATNVMTLQVEWPSGTVQVMTNVLANQVLTITEPRRPVLACRMEIDGAFVLKVTVDPEQEWQAEWSADFITWTPVTDLWFKGSTELVEQPPLPAARFYRVTVVNQP